MPDASGGRDEPARSPGDRSELLSQLDSHDLSLAVDPQESTERGPFEVDRDVVAAYHVPEGEVDLQDVTDENRD